MVYSKPRPSPQAFWRPGEMKISFPQKILSLLRSQRLDINRLLLYLSLFLRGSLTQTVEYLPFKQRVVGSSPTRPTNIRKQFSSPSSSQVQDTGLSRRRHEFKSRWGRHIVPRESVIYNWFPFLFPAPKSYDDTPDGFLFFSLFHKFKHVNHSYGVQWTS